MNKVLLFFVIVQFTTTQIQSLKILMLFTTAARSHYILGSALARGLADKGHRITMISPYGEKDPPENYRDIILTNVSSFADNKDFNAYDVSKMGVITHTIIVSIFSNQEVKKILNDKAMQEFMQSNETFDVMIIEQFLNDALKGLAYKYKIPHILFNTCASNNWVNPLIGNPDTPSYIPQFLVKFSHMNFLDRVHNFIAYIANYLSFHLIYYPAQNRILKEYFSGAPELSDLIYNASLVLVNSAWSINKAVPRLPNMIDIGGFHLKPAQNLPEDLQEFLDKSENGAIYFSLGSYIRPSDLPLDIIKIFLNVFGKLKQNILIKWDNTSDLNDISSNVKLYKWLPQNDLLAHRNIKLFITHGGLLSLMESVYHAVPILSFPILGDQIANSQAIEQFNIGSYLNIMELTEDKLLNAISEILDNDKYLKAIQRRSKMLRDFDITPIDKADYWIRYVVEYQGATHLRNDGLDLAWYQYLCIDVVVFLLICLLVSIVLFAIIIKLGCNCLRSLFRRKEKMS